MSIKLVFLTFTCFILNLLANGHVIQHGTIEDLLLTNHGFDVENVPANDNITYYSYHIHVYFLQKNENQTNEATSLRNRFIERFNVDNCNDDCETWCPKICHWDLNMAPIG